MKRQWEQNFLDWARKEDILFKRFDVLSQIFNQYFIDNVLISSGRELESDENPESVVKNFYNVLSNCNKLTYDEPGVPEAYAFMHFLDRYRRFQINYMYLIEQSLLPLNNKRALKIIDFGTGPAQALFAISDIYNMIKQYGKIRSDKVLENINFQTDYLERSNGFRKWLHNFTEYANFRRIDFGWNIPYHHGTYSDFTDLELVRNDFVYTNNLNLRYTKVRDSFDLAIFSNFITKLEHVELHKDQIQEIVRQLRNRGLLVITGAVGSERNDYPQIYKRITEIITEEDYNSNEYVASCKIIKEGDLSFSLDDKYGELIKLSYRLILERIKDLEIIELIPKKSMNKLNISIKDVSGEKNPWKLLVYRKTSRIRYR